MDYGVSIPSMKPSRTSIRRRHQAVDRDLVLK
jgi:hypothetical protein